MCLSVAVHRPNDVLASGTHAEHEWMIVHNGMGFRCGYVKVNPGHPWHGKDYNDIEASVHGGLTFGEHDEPCHKVCECTCRGPKDTAPITQHSILCPVAKKDDGFWVGFDCAHSQDSPDPDLLNSDSMPAAFRNQYGTIKTQAYVEKECHDLCEQALAAIPFAEAA